VHFAQGGNIIIVRFTGAVEPTLSIKDLCPWFVVDAADTSAAVLGASPLCTRVKSTEWHITLGSGATITPGSQVMVRPNAIAAAESSSAFYSSPVEVTVGVLDDAATPVLSLEAPSTAGSCGDVTVRAVTLAGSAGRGLDVTWQVSHAAGASANSAAQLQTAARDASAANAVVLVLPQAAVQAAHSYNITAVARNFLGIQSTPVAVSIRVVDQRLPTLTVPGGLQQRVHRTQRFKLSALGTWRSCTGASDDAAAFSYSFRLQAPAGISHEPGVIASGRHMVVPAGELFPSALPYQVLVTARSGSATVSTTVSVLVQSAAVRAVIVGGHGVVDARTGLTLDASSSEDPNNDALVAGGAFQVSARSYSWQCLPSAGQVCPVAVQEAVSRAASSTLTLSTPHLEDMQGQTVMFAVNVTASGVSAVAYSRVEVSSAPVQTGSVQLLDVYIQAPAGSRESFSRLGRQIKVPNTGAIAFNAAVGANSDSAAAATLRYSWEVRGVAQADVLGSTQRQVLTLDAASLPVPPQAALTVAVTVQGYSDAGQLVLQGSSTVTVAANAPPSSGSIALPRTAVALQDFVELSLDQWEDDASDLPLSHECFVAADGSMPSEQDMQRRTFGSAVGQRTKSTRMRLLAPSSRHVNGSVTVLCYVMDSMGSTTTAVATFQSIAAPSAAVAQSLASASELIDVATDEGDTAGSLSMAATLADGYIATAADATAGQDDDAVTQAVQAFQSKVVDLALASAGSADGTADADEDDSIKVAALDAVAAVTKALRPMTASTVEAARGFLRVLLQAYSSRSSLAGRTLQAGSAAPRALPLAVAQRASSVIGNLHASGLVVHAGAARRLRTAAVAARRSSTSTQRKEDTDFVQSMQELHGKAVYQHVVNGPVVQLTGQYKSAAVGGACAPAVSNARSSFLSVSAMRACSGDSSVDVHDSDVGALVSSSAACPAAVAFRAAMASSGSVGAITSSARISGAGVCSSPELAVHMLALPAALPSLALDRQSLRAELLGSAQLASGGVGNSSLTLGSGDISTALVLVQGGNASSIVRVRLPITAFPGVTANKTLVAVHGPSHKSRRRAQAAGGEQDAGSYSVQCPAEKQAYASGAVTVATGCPLVQGHSVDCRVEHAGGRAEGACPVDALVPVCLRADISSGSYSTAGCSVVSVGVSDVVCECSGGGLIASHFATTNDEGTLQFVEAIKFEEEPPVAPDEAAGRESSNLGAIVGSTAGGLVCIIAVAGFISYRLHQRRATTRYPRRSRSLSRGLSVSRLPHENPLHARAGASVSLALAADLTPEAFVPRELSKHNFRQSLTRGASARQAFVGSRAGGGLHQARKSPASKLVVDAPENAGAKHPGAQQSSYSSSHAKARVRVSTGGQANWSKLRNATVGAAAFKGPVKPKRTFGRKGKPTKVSE